MYIWEFNFLKWVCQTPGRYERVVQKTFFFPQQKKSSATFEVSFLIKGNKMLAVQNYIKLACLVSIRMIQCITYSIFQLFQEQKFIIVEFQTSPKEVSFIKVRDFGNEIL